MKHKLVFIASLFSLAFFAALNANAQWMKTSCPYASYVNCFVVSGTNLFAGTQDSGVYLSTDSGISWTEMSNGLPTSSGYCPVECLVVSGTKIFAGLGNVAPGGVFRSTDGGKSWTTANTVLTNNTVYALAVSGSNLLASTGHVFISTNDGTSWTVIDSGLSTSQTVYSVAVCDSNLFAGSGSIDSGNVFRSTNNGTTWVAVSNGLPNDLGPFEAFAVSGSNLFAGIANVEVNTGDVFLSTNSGTSWAKVNNGLPSFIGAVSSLAVNGSNLFAGILGGGVYMPTNNGTSWISVNSGLTDSTVFSLAVCGPYLFAGTDSGVWRRRLSDFGISSVAQTPAVTPSKIQIYPNPFSQSTEITFTSPTSGYAEVSIVNMLGVEVARLFSGELGAGEHSFVWDAGRDACTTGVYECLVRMNGQVETLPVVLMH